MRSVIISLAMLLVLGCQNQEQIAQLETLNTTVTGLKEDKSGLQNQVGQLQKENKSLKAKLKKLNADLQSAQQAKNKVKAEDLIKTLGLKKGQKLYATFQTSMGDLVAELYPRRAPETVANFVALAEGTKKWTDPKTREQTQRPLYAGTVFHRVIPNFMIQGGDPLGTGRGGPGYRFADEFDPSLRHDGPGVLSMANSGRNTNGSQFFITEKATPHLDNKHSVFGKVTENVELVGQIARVKTQGGNRPLVPIILKDVLIGRGSPKR